MANLRKLFTALAEEKDYKFKSVYPRPQLKRNSFFTLDGEWDFGVSDDNEIFDSKINVPFCPESILSGVDEVYGDEKIRWYKRKFVLPDNFNIGRVLLNFGAVDQVCTVYINGTEVGCHIGGYDAFSFDITGYLREENVLKVKVIDKLDKHILPYGKQCHKRKGMWYTPVSGIWQTVWCESVPKEYVKSLKIDVTLNSAIISVNGVKNGLVKVFDGDSEIVVPIVDGRAEVKISKPHNWSPEDPYLYPFKVICGGDSVESYFALRTLSIGKVDGKNRLLLNGEPYFFHGLLDQGYFSDGIFTPAQMSEYTNDILRMKELGFNMLRKHIKVEPEFFYYECDRLGMVVFQDMVNNGKYSFIRDTMLPTIGLLRKNDKLCHTDKDTRGAFISLMEKTVNGLYNHPSVCQWTVFNEGWGQFCADEMYLKLKMLDSSRFIDSASGWFKAKNNDFDSRHIYFRKIRVKKSNKPIFISEFGGYSYKLDEHSFNLDNTYGYGSFSDREKFVKALRNLYLNEVIPLIDKGVCATVYTQLSDVEDETNGLLTYDRKISKILPEEFIDISEKLRKKLL
ncbi:MAG: glycoside hydrolase family 2 [Ruminococcaceae bacterium]|nr:glycoside hydrolase family 2 [Oscillospiraceae bacterium]